MHSSENHPSAEQALEARKRVIRSSSCTASMVGSGGEGVVTLAECAASEARGTGVGLLRGAPAAFAPESGGDCSACSSFRNSSCTCVGSGIAVVARVQGKRISRARPNKYATTPPHLC